MNLCKRKRGESYFYEGSKKKKEKKTGRKRVFSRSRKQNYIFVINDERRIW